MGPPRSAILILACTLLLAGSSGVLAAFTIGAGSSANVPAILVSGGVNVGIDVKDVTINVKMLQSITYYVKVEITFNGVVAPGLLQFPADLTGLTGEYAIKMYGLQDGIYVIKVFGFEHGTDVQSVNSVTFPFKVDVALPMTTLISVPPALSNYVGFIFEFQGSKTSTVYGLNEFYCSVDGAPFFSCYMCSMAEVPCIGSYQINSAANGVDPDGPHTFKVAAKYTFTSDPTMIQDEAQAKEVSFVIDATAPDFEVLETPALTTNELQATFRFSCSDVNGCNVKCKLDGYAIDGSRVREWTTCKSPVVLDVTSRTHAFQIFAQDDVGNSSPIGLYSWLVHTTPPIASFDTTNGVLAIPGNFKKTTITKVVNGVPTMALHKTNSPTGTFRFKCSHPQSP